MEGKSLSPGARFLVTLRRLPIVLSGLTALRVAASFLTYALAARRFGAGTELDVYFLAVTPLLAVVSITEAAGIGAAINFTFRQQGRGRELHARALAGLFVHLAAFLLLVGIVFAFCAGIAARSLGGGLPADQIPRLERMLRMSAVGIAVAPYSMVTGVGLLRAKGRFLTAASLAFIPVTFQLVALLTIGHTAERLLLALVVGHAFSAVVGASTSAHLMRPAWLAPLHTAPFTFFREIAPLGIAEALLWAVYLRERQLAAALPPGSISALVLGQRVVAVAGTVVSTGIEHTALPAISSAHFAGVESTARRRSRDALAFGSLLTVLAGIALFSWPDGWVALLFGGGAFGTMATLLTATAASGYVGIFVFNSLGRLAMVVNYGTGLGWRVVVANAILLCTYLIVSPVLLKSGGFGGLAVAASVSFILGTILAVAVGLGSPKRSSNSLTRERGGNAAVASSPSVSSQ